MAETTLTTSLDHAVRIDLPGEEYYLTMFQERDSADVHEILAMASVSDRLLKVPKPYTLEMATQWVTARVASNMKLLSVPTLSARNQALFSPGQCHAVPLQAIRLKTGQYVGCVSLTPRGGKSVELGYYLHPAHHGKGIMVAAAKVALRWAREEFGVEEIYGSADCTNGRSERVMARVVRETSVVGSVLEGREVLSWPVEKKIEGREVDSLSKVWEWKV